MINNEKAPLEAATSEQSAREFIHPQNTPDFGNCQEPVDPVIPELIKVMHHDGSVKVSEDRFFDLFSFGNYDVDQGNRYSTTVGGVEFFCEVKKENTKGEVGYEH